MPQASVELVRHATLRVTYGDAIILVDPMLAEVGAYAPVADSANSRRNPLVPLHLALEDILKDVTLVLVTHTHGDHWDDAAVKALPKDVDLRCQPPDKQKIRENGFSRAEAIDTTARVGEIEIARTGGQHGSGDVGKRMGPVSGFVLAARGLPRIYIAGDTIWCPEVQDAIARHTPDVIVVNAGAAQFNTGGPITMAVADVASVVRAAPMATVIAVHMEAWNHCLLTRNRLRDGLQQAGVAKRVAIPDDSELITAG